MEITHLVVNGCSWTYCTGLDNIKEQGWPTLLAKKLGCEVVNLAVPGTGNRSIMRRTYEYVYENLKYNSKPLFVLVWSQYWRKEAWFKKWGSAGNSHYCNDFDMIHFPNDKPEDCYQQALLDNWDEQDFLRSTLLDKLATINLLKTYNISYLSSDAFYENWKTETMTSIKNRLPNMYEKGEEVNNTIDLYTISRKYKSLPCGHDGPDAMVEIADTYYDQILKNYGKPIIHPGNFLRLENFKLHNTREAVFSAWK